MMRRILFLFIPFFLFANEANESSYLNIPKISVTGDAVINVLPDEATIFFGVEVRDDTVEKAKGKYHTIIEGVMKVLSQYDIDQKDTFFDYFSVMPRYRYYKKSEKVDYFSVKNAVSIKVRDPKKVEPIISELLKAGVTHIHNVSFQTKLFKTYREEARVKALKAAKEKAEKMASVYGKKVDDVLSIRDIKQYYSYRSNYTNISQNVMERSSDSTKNTFVPGKISIKAGVSVTFTLK